MKFLRKAMLRLSLPALVLALAAGVVLLAAAGSPRARAAESTVDRPIPGMKAFRVCADPDNPPLSTQDRTGYENKIAALFAKELGLPVEYTWFPQRMGFVRKTLRNNDTPDGKYKCDIIMGVVQGFELAKTTKPYYRSAWAMVYEKGKGLDHIHSLADLAAMPAAERDKLRIGAFDRSSIVAWLKNHGMLNQLVPYQSMSGDPHAYPGQIIERDLVDGKIDMTFVWGPIAGYFAKELEKTKHVDLAVIPLTSQPNIPFDYNICMAVRFGDDARMKLLNHLIDENHAKIDKILTEYGVPLLPIKYSKSKEHDNND